MFSSFINQVNIIGTTKPKNPKINDLILNKDGSCEIFCGDSWISCTSTTNSYDKYYTSYDPSYIEPKVEYKELKPSICSCCGAPLRSNKCEYCGMEYR